MRNQDAYGLFNFDYSRRDASTGTWLDIVGSNLGLQTRELGALWSRQGDWSVKADYNELVARQSVHRELGRCGHRAPQRRAPCI